jgi:hypothetical protein
MSKSRSKLKNEKFPSPSGSNTCLHKLLYYLIHMYWWPLWILIAWVSMLSCAMLNFMSHGLLFMILCTKWSFQRVSHHISSEQFASFPILGTVSDIGMVYAMVCLVIDGFMSGRLYAHISIFVIRFQRAFSCHTVSLILQITGSSNEVMPRRNISSSSIWVTVGPRSECLHVFSILRIFRHSNDPLFGLQTILDFASFLMDVRRWLLSIIVLKGAMEESLFN